MFTLSYKLRGRRPIFDSRVQVIAIHILIPHPFKSFDLYTAETHSHQTVFKLKKIAVF